MKGPCSQNERKGNPQKMVLVKSTDVQKPKLGQNVLTERKIDRFIDQWIGRKKERKIDR